MLTETAYAKVNLALHVRRRRDDGYHEIESLFVFADDGDLLRAELAPSGKVALVIDGPFAAGLDAGADNLVVKAARALLSAAGGSHGAHLHLTKNLPVASGIGGGSADAAAALRLLVRLWRLDIPAADLAAIALSLGSDVPACLHSVTQMVGGRGEALTSVAPTGLASTPMLLVNPAVPVSTGPVFAGWDRVDRGPLEAIDLPGIIAQGRNDLQAPAITIAPAIAEVLAALDLCEGVRLARMSGSGATCFALFDDMPACTSAAATLGAARPDWWIMATEIRNA
ncbi:4-(cytidine 5'-diphospho)-2-C-methyl-D-erythritol kinase [Sphingobium sp. H39-3-25]|uniref:4-(cytidine 5'-diphospho)-2-C-methyl-D-erythritol kinase n=1 Tax=Sphingobium arseniciresistens TaxID=3030834 RepID=UPI0023B99299|nr:4-(cytidine 5'-diphospho)-2-C-methyl-D-erythritol kinase [Sphingobium arseniciresistens]